MAEVGQETKKRILDAAERLFGERGIEATSLRAVIAEAGVNLAAVHYHFGSRQGLLREVIRREFDPLNRQRLELLDKYEAEAGNGAVPLRKLLEAFVAPVIRAAADPKHGMDLTKLAGRLLGEPDYFVGEVAPVIFKDLSKRFGRALARTLPEVPARELFWRMMFGVGVMAHTLRIAPYAEALSNGLCKKPDPEKTLERVVTFLEAGLRAPVTGGIQ